MGAGAFTGGERDSGAIKFRKAKLVPHWLGVESQSIYQEDVVPFSTDLSYAQELDQQDVLAAYRDEFVIGDPDLIYLDGNSLGRLPKRSLAVMQDLIEQQWGDQLVRGWQQGWFEAPSRIGAKIAALIGARPDEVLVSESTSTNLFKLVVAALRARPGRSKIVSDALNFPSDLYIFQGVIDLVAGGQHLEVVASEDGIHVNTADVAAALDENTALLSLTHVAFKSAFMYDMQALTELAHQAGALALWDLSHSVGAVPLYLNDWGVDLAVGCTYKYLNAGPGAPAFLYVRRELQPALVQPIWGWFAAHKPFDFALDFLPAEGISRFGVSTPPVLALSAIEPGVELLLEAGMERLRTKSVQQSEYLIALAEAWLSPLGFSLGSPRASWLRGSHVSLRHGEAYRINRAMIEAQPPAVRIIPDFRTPDNLRLGIAPLYTRFVDIHRALERIRQIVLTKAYQQYPHERQAVT